MGLRGGESIRGVKQVEPSSFPYLSFSLSFFLPSIHFYESGSSVSVSSFFPQDVPTPIVCLPVAPPPPLSFGQLDNHFVNTLNLKKQKRRRRRNHGMKSRCGWSAFRRTFSSNAG